jgi:hypothetical protein
LPCVGQPWPAEPPLHPYFYSLCRAILTCRDRAGSPRRSTACGSTTLSPPSSARPRTDPGWNTGAPLDILYICIWLIWTFKLMQNLRFDVKALNCILLPLCSTS